MRATACNDSCHAASDRARESRRHFAFLRDGLARVRHLMQLRRERNQLRELSDHQLRDIGLTRREVVREARRHFWDDIGWRR